MHQNFFKVLLIILLVVLLTSCGPGTSTRSTTTSTPQGLPIAFDVADLHVQSDHGIQCYNHYNWTFPTEHANLVLASDRLNYDSAEIEQMTKYVTAYFTSSPRPALPSTLSYVMGGAKLWADFIGWIGCFEEITLTNVGKDAIQIHSMNVRLTAAPQPNNKEQYRLIDVCSLLPSSITEKGCPGGRGGGQASYYYYQLSPVSAGHVFSPQEALIDATAPSNTMPNNLKSLLEPSDIEVIDLLFDSSPSTFIYSIMPQLIVDTSNGQQTINMPQLSGNLYFADNSQFSCYTLKGNTFVKVANRAGSFFLSEKGFCI